MTKSNRANKIISAAIITINWTAITLSSFYFSTEILTTLLPFIVTLIIIYPICTFSACFIFSKKYGYSFILQITMILVCLVEYFFLGFDEIGTPNFLVFTIIFILLGSAIGSGFSNVEHETISDKINKRKLKKQQDEKEYKSIIDDK